MSVWGSCEVPGENSSSRAHRKRRDGPTLWVQTKVKRARIDTYLNVKEVVRKSMKKR